MFAGLILIAYRSFENFLIAFTKFMQRILAIVNYENHPNLLRLSTEAVRFLKDSKDSQEIRCLARMNDLLSLASRKHIDYEALIPLEAMAIVENDERTNTSLQVAVISTFYSVLAAHYSSSALSATVDSLASHSWSPLQVLAKAHLYGAQLVMEAICHTWATLPLTVRTLLAFRALRDKAFATARQILEPEKTFAMNMGKDLWNTSWLEHSWCSVTMPWRWKMMQEF